MRGYLGRGEAEYGIKPVGSVRGGKKAHLHINPSPTHGLESKEER